MTIVDAMNSDDNSNGNEGRRLAEEFISSTKIDKTEKKSFLKRLKRPYQMLPSSKKTLEREKLKQQSLDKRKEGFRKFKEAQKKSYKEDITSLNKSNRDKVKMQRVRDAKVKSVDNARRQKQFYRQRLNEQRKETALMNLPVMQRLQASKYAYLEQLRERNQATIAVQNKAKVDLILDKKFRQQQRDMSKQHNILNAPQMKAETMDILSEEYSILKAPSMFSENKHNIMITNRPNILQTRQAGNGLNFFGDSMLKKKKVRR